MACQIGGVVATDDPLTIEELGVFGNHVGVIKQLLNDLGGVSPYAGKHGSDLRRRKKTLPIAYALRCAQENDHSEVLSWYQPGGTVSEVDESQLAVTLREIGALHYTWLIADIHRRQALATLRSLAKVIGRSEIDTLRHLIPPASSMPAPS
jgi:geranylgeranyl pyrophosphate synthase